MVEKNENIGRNTENMGKKQDQLAHGLIETQQNMVKLGEFTLKMQTDNQHHSRIIEHEMGKIQERVADTQTAVTENRAGVMILEQNLKEVEIKEMRSDMIPIKMYKQNMGDHETKKC